MFRSQVHALASQEIGSGGLDAAATTMARRPCLATPGVSVDIVGFTCPRSSEGRPSVRVAVSMSLQPGRRASAVHWEEAHAWAGAVAGGEWAAAEYVGSQESPGGMVFHYALKTAEDPYAVPEYSAVPEYAVPEYAAPEYSRDYSTAL
ncbi:hypothetical protein ACFVTE_02820 [Arthrobacter sp. NPDC058097]|uniref:hypothetical protein n=1 Tax=Arthrobacter sp. NPDC058097 TaxID=3346340 RepID=UPI0036D8D0E0